MTQGLSRASLEAMLGEIARGMLRKAWLDFYSSSYDWALEKAYKAALTLLEPSEPWAPLPWRALARGCPEEVVWRLQVLDYRRRLAFEPILRLVLGVLETEPSRGEALDAIEATVMLAGYLPQCTGSGDGGRSIHEELIEYGVSSGATILLQGLTAIVVREHYTGVDPKERIQEERGRLPLGLGVVLLAPDEAYALAGVPGYEALLEGAEPVVDRLGIAHVLL